MKFASLFLFGAAALLTVPASAQLTQTAQSSAPVKIKTKTKGSAVAIKTKSVAGAVPARVAGAAGAPQRVETLSGIDVYPKPASNRVLLSFTQQFTQPGTLTMTNAAKAVVYQQALDPRASTGAPVDLGHLPAGTYLVEAKTGNYVYWRQVRVKYPTANRY